MGKLLLPGTTIPLVTKLSTCPEPWAGEPGGPDEAGGAVVAGGLATDILAAAELTAGGPPAAPLAKPPPISKALAIAIGRLVNPCGTLMPGVTNLCGAFGSFTCGAAMTDVATAPLAFPSAGGAEHGAVTVTYPKISMNPRQRKVERNIPS